VLILLTVQTMLVNFGNKRKGSLNHNLGLLDALIGQMAVALNLPLHTFNRKHYASIPDLVMLQPSSKL
jgi:predicted nucleic acid-binding protein